MDSRHPLNMNRGFLILGLTGPLRSGCTTAANMFCGSFQEKVGEIATKTEQVEIEACYRQLKEYMESCDGEEYKIEKEKRKLYKHLKKREIAGCLSRLIKNNEVKNFYKISMSNMLFKFTVEYYLEKKPKHYEARLENFIKAIEERSFDFEKIKSVVEIIKNKRFRDLENDDYSLCKFYDDYIKKLDDLNSEIRSSYGNEEVYGTIMQDLGDNIRKNGNPFQSFDRLDETCCQLIAEEANFIIKYFRNRPDRENRKKHFVIESFRNPYEVLYFRYRYYEFYLMSIYTDKEIRQSERGVFSVDRDERDQGEKNRADEIYAQNVSACVDISDIAINNNGTLDEYFAKLVKYYAIIMQPGVINPESDEMFMNQAYSLSLKSSCISRQVGAVIIGANGYVVGAGWNDAGEGQVGCGYRHGQEFNNLDNSVLVSNPDNESSFREKLKNNPKEFPFCYKDNYSSFVSSKKIKKLLNNKRYELKKIGVTEEGQEKLFAILTNGLSIKRLEYCRALHAEENALLQTSKNGGMGVRGGTIYTTSFPCELCAKKIYQSGIREIVFTEPYPDSISKEVILRDGVKKVTLRQFEGVKSHSYFRLYKPGMDKKELISILTRPKPEPELPLFSRLE
ncbi:hypothetical protein B5V00_10230 [Geothermobacter hydrogeniphilus]|uniref:CMP/dCMP-type deaminase domain-containing protein n=2 Tax=Geothermobacter hydrogeniphilus TaxID=1969733 RepID=A0A1X0Y268_9BACT|nr:hypothetical protein B5V00_10230 [Geothermobacter hydrogeniphilus]